MPLPDNIIVRYLVLTLFFACISHTVHAQSAAFSKIKCVVIDPGHGGHDPGVPSPGGKYKEKDIVLPISLKLGSMIKNKFPDIKVIYTRSTDKFVPLVERSNIANRNNADLFISIHVNGVDSQSPNGTETYVMGTHNSQSNFELCKAENSVIVMEDNYTAKYEGFNPNSPESYIIFSLLQNTHLEQSLKLAELMQKNYKSGPIYGNRGVKQGGLIVLWRCTMPAILTEIGFMSNPKDRSVLISKDGQHNFALKMFKAFCEYKKIYEETSSADISAQTTAIPPEPKPQQPAKENQTASSNEYYSIQILSVNKLLKRGASDLKGLKEYEYIKSGNAYKYITGKYATRSQAQKALPSVRKKFKGAFIVGIKNKSIIK